MTAPKTQYQRAIPLTCDYMEDFRTNRRCRKPTAFWYPAMGGGVMALCEEHGAKHFPNGAQRVTDSFWHGGGEPLPVDQPEQDR